MIKQNYRQEKVLSTSKLIGVDEILTDDVFIKNDEVNLISSGGKI